MGLFGQVADKVALDFILDEGDPLRRVRAAVLLTMPKILRGINQIDYSIIVTSDKDRGTYQLRSTTAIGRELAMDIVRVGSHSGLRSILLAQQSGSTAQIIEDLTLQLRSHRCKHRRVFGQEILVARL